MSGGGPFRILVLSEMGCAMTSLKTVFVSIVMSLLSALGSAAATVQTYTIHAEGAFTSLQYGGLYAYDQATYAFQSHQDITFSNADSASLAGHRLSTSIDQRMHRVLELFVPRRHADFRRRDTKLAQLYRQCQLDHPLCGGSGLPLRRGCRLDLRQHQLLQFWWAGDGRVRGFLPRHRSCAAARRVGPAIGRHLSAGRPQDAGLRKPAALS